VWETNDGRGLLKLLLTYVLMSALKDLELSYWPRLRETWKFILNLTAQFDRTDLLSILRKIKRYSAKLSILQFVSD